MDFPRANGDHTVARQLRQEVGFRCPVPGCGRLILTYHHFDPRWSESPHNDPAGMIALCPTCHGKADGNQWTQQQLRHFKANPPIHIPSRENLLCLEPHLSPVYRIGGNYLLYVECLIFGDRPILWQSRAPDGIMLFSFDLRGEDGDTLLAVRENTLTVDDLKCWDFYLNKYANHLVGRQRRGEIALDLHFRLPWEEENGNDNR